MSIVVPAVGEEVVQTWGASVANYINDHTTTIAAALSSFSTTQTQIIGRTITADTFTAGSTYRLLAYGTVTSNGTNAVTFRVRCGPTTLTGAIAGTRAPNATATASADPFLVEFLFTVRTIGASGTCYASSHHIGQTSNPFNTIAFVTAGSSVAVDTTIDNVLELTGVTAAAGTTVTIQQAVIECLTAS